MREDDPLDRLIDSALATYADPGPDSGLDQRALARIAAEGGDARTRRWLPWASALSIAACLLILMMFFGSKLTRRTADGANQARISQPARDADRGGGPLFNAQSTATRHVSASRPQTRAGHIVSVAKTAPLPKLDIFPTPQPLTPAEQELAEFAAHASDADRQSFVDAQEQAQAPLHVDPIQVPPIPPPTQDEN